MGKRVRIWIMRIIAILIVAFMVVELGANIFTSNTSSKSDKTEEKTTTKKSKYSYVNETSVFHLDGINQDVLLPKGMTVQSKNEDQNTHAITYNFGGVKYDGFSAVCTGAKDSDSPGYISLQGEKGWIKLDGKPNSAQGVVSHYIDESNPNTVKDASGGTTRASIEEHFEPPQEYHRMVGEFKEFAEIIDKKDYERAAKFLAETVTVVEVLEKARSKAGIKF